MVLPRAKPEVSYPHKGIHSIRLPPLGCHISFIIPNKPHNDKISKFLLIISNQCRSLMQVKRPSAVLDEVKVTDDR